MTSLSAILRKVLSGGADYCCLCFKSVGEVDTSYYNIKDEVSFDNSTEEMFEVICTVLGDNVLDNILTHIICQQCTKLTLNCYKFIQSCKKNIQNLYHITTSIENHTKELKEDTNCFQTLFLALDTCNYNVDQYYDKTQLGNDPAVLYKKFQCIQEEYRKKDFIQIDFELESNIDYEKRDVKKEKYSYEVQSYQLSDNVYNNEEIISYKCKICLKSYPTSMKLKQHDLRVHAPKDHKCSQCPRSFGTSLLLKRHTKDSHCTVVCSQCGKTYTNTYSLRHHEKSHKLCLICHTCGKIYKGKRALENHIKMNLCDKIRKSNAEAKFMCDYCNKKYSQKGALSVHLRLEHENGKALNCEWCSKKFSSMSKLRDHIIKHTKQKNFECAVCGGKFVTKASLLYHTRTHTGEKPYKCEHCEKTFLSISRRTEHVKRHHSPLIFECDICHGKFKGNTCLLRHRKRHFDASSRLYHKPPVLTGIDE